MCCPIIDLSRITCAEQSHTEDQLNTLTSTPKKVFTNKTMKAANHFPMNMTWISRENAKAGDELTISTSRRSPLSQKSTSSSMEYSLHYLLFLKST
ncbi:hypothetical protein JTB14_005548 [Gonioctena quinquepunctata]|nr:hypothetical protein JTB14_005548 [Gonioctena quinquepunctata]